MIVELVLVVCMQQGECATFRQQISQADCVSKITKMEDKYGRDPSNPPYVEYANCRELNYEEPSTKSDP